MKQSEIVQQLLTIYEDCLVKLWSAKNIHEAKAICERERTGCGLCFCADKRLNIDIRNMNWLKHFVQTESGHWCVWPFYCHTIEMVQYSIQARIYIMKQILNL